MALPTCNNEHACQVTTPEAAREEILRIKLGTSAPEWEPCGCKGCHWCEIGAALRHPVLVAALMGYELRVNPSSMSRR